MNNINLVVNLVVKWYQFKIIILLAGAVAITFSMWWFFICFMTSLVCLDTYNIIWILSNCLIELTCGTDLVLRSTVGYHDGTFIFDINVIAYGFTVLTWQNGSFARL